MKLSTRCFVALVVCLSVSSVVISTVSATDVGGMINSDTTWTLGKSPYIITSTVQVPEGVTLTIQPGVVVGNGTIEVWGTLSAVGVNNSRIILDDVTIRNKEGCVIIIEFADVFGGSIHQFEYACGRFTVTDSILRSVDAFWVGDASFSSQYIIKRNYFLDCDDGGWYFIMLKNSLIDCHIEQNIFQGCGTIYLSGSVTSRYYIKFNLFYDQGGESAIYDGSSSESNITIEYNSFLNNDRIAVECANSAENNYWNTTGAFAIDSMIRDGNDDSNCSRFTSYSPFLTLPHPNTPALEDIPDLNDAPIYYYNYYLPYFRGGPDYWTGLGLSNLSATEAANLEAVIYDENGAIQIIEEANIPKRGQKAFIAGKEFPDEGWIKIRSTQSLAGLCFIGNKGINTYMADIPFTSESSQNLIIPHVAQDGTWDTRIMVCNPNDSQTTLTLTLFNRDGTEMYTASRTIPSNGSLTCDLSEMAPDSGSSISGRVEMSADQGVVAFGLYNNLKTGGYCFSGINAVVP